MLKHIWSQPFVVATGVAALIHSTWALGTLFAGLQPDPAIDGWFAYAAWLLPALLIAFALDVGQIATSAEIRQGNRTRARYLTFIVLSGATFYLQWLYMAHHMPSLELAKGVRDLWGPVPGFMRDAAVWVIPALLPLATTLYTLSDGAVPTRTDNAAPTVSPGTAIVPVIEVESAITSVSCPHCSWTGEYKTGNSAQMALKAHLRHCAAAHGAQLSFERVDVEVQA